MLKISKNSSLTDIVSTDGSNPISTETPMSGGSIETELYLFNDDSTKKYQSITIYPTDSNDSSKTSWIQLAPDNSGSPGLFLSGGAIMNMPNISGNTAPFWIKVTTPEMASVENITEIKLTVDYKEYVV